MIIETNLIALIFNSCLQLLAFVSLDLYGKINSILCIVTLFVAILYSSVFYSEVYLSEKGKAAETLLKFSFYSVKSFYFESYCFLMRAVVRGMIQGSLFRTYYSQIISLACSDVVFVMLIIFFRK